MSITFAELNALLAQFWWPFFRISAAMLAMPFFGDKVIPLWIRTLFALSVAVLVAPLLPAMPTTDLLSFAAIWLALEQIIWGIMFGLLVHMLFAVLTMLGDIIALQMGLSMAVMNDPANGSSSTVLARIFTLFATLLFLALNGHLLVLDILINSFKTWPVGSGLALPSLQQVIAAFAWMLSAALALALPAITCMLLANLAFGIMNRAAPALNIFALGFPLTMLLGLFSVFISISSVPDQYTELVHYCLRQLQGFTVGGI